jgi:hypothetical protein
MVWLKFVDAWIGGKSGEVHDKLNNRKSFIVNDKNAFVKCTSDLI